MRSARTQLRGSCIVAAPCTHVPLPDFACRLTTAVTGVALVGAVLVAVCTLQNLTSRYMPGLDKAVLARIRRGPVCQLIARATVTLRSYLPRR